MLYRYQVNPGFVKSTAIELADYIFEDAIRYVPHVLRHALDNSVRFIAMVRIPEKLRGVPSEELGLLGLDEHVKIQEWIKGHEYSGHEILWVYDKDKDLKFKRQDIFIPRPDMIAQEFETLADMANYVQRALVGSEYEQVTRRIFALNGVVEAFEEIIRRLDNDGWKDTKLRTTFSLMATGWMTGAWSIMPKEWYMTR